jgi:putative membrane protein
MTSLRSKPKIKWIVYSFGLIGAGLFTLLLARAGAPEVARAMSTIGWWLLVIALYHLFPMFLDTFEWWILFPGPDRIRLPSLYLVRWIGESVSNLVPAAQVGGDLVRTRLAILKGVSVSIATATVLVDITVSVFTQTLFTLIGLSLLLIATGQTRLIGPTLAAAPVALAGVAAFYALQRLGLFRLFGAVVSRYVNDPKWKSLVRKGGEVDQNLAQIYQRKGTLFACFLITLTSFFVGSVEVWIGMQALGLPQGFSNAVILESVGQGVQTLLCLVPGGLGVREGGYVVVGGLLGIPGDAAFALALIRRVRELATGIPGLIVWQLFEGKRLFRVARRSCQAPEQHLPQGIDA